jgi:hypothetical protein
MKTEVNLNRKTGKKTALEHAGLRWLNRQRQLKNRPETKITNLRSFGYGLPRKPRIFQACTESDRARPIGRGLAYLLCRRFAVPLGRMR